MLSYCCILLLFSLIRFIELREFYASLLCFAFSALTLLVGRQEWHPAHKNRVLGASVVICLERDADLHMAQLMPLPLTVSCFSKIQIGFTFLVPARPGSSGQRAIKLVCVFVCACACVCVCVSVCYVLKCHYLALSIGCCAGSDSEVVGSHVECFN